jgi:lysophospholipase L1-like esterase
VKNSTKFITLVILTLLPFVLVELGLRLSGYHLEFPYEDDPDMGYVFQPNYKGPGPELYGMPRKIPLKINHLGFRGKETNVQKGKNITRIAVLGDSCTFGLGIEEEKTFPSLTEKMLNDHSRADQRFEVINAGVPGYTSYQGLQMLKKRVLPLNPDYIVLYFGWNDHWYTDRGITDQENFPEMRDYIAHRIQKNKKNPLRKLRLYQNLTDFLLRLQDSTRHNTVKPKPDKLVYRVPIPQYIQNLGEMITLANQGGIPVLVITPPHGFEKGNIPIDYLIENLMRRDDTLITLHQNYIESTRMVAQQKNAVLLDIAKFFAETDFTKLMEIDGIHPNTAGHRIIAQEIGKTIRVLKNQRTLGDPVAHSP